jgi:glycosyltransferase involved in cell wall biosynthesis
MRILICALDGYTPRTNGTRLAVGALIDELRKMHEIRYIGYRMPDQRSLPNDPAIRLIDPPAHPFRGMSLLRATLRRRPWEADRLAAGLEDVLMHELETFDPDVVHVTYWGLAGLGRVISDVPCVLTTFDAWHLNIDASLAVAKPLRRASIRAEAARVRLFEAEEFQRFGRVVVVTEQDKAALLALNPSLRISVIPNGVDAHFFTGDHATSVPGRMVFTGNMNYPPNVAAANFLVRGLVPLVQAARPDAQAVIVGRNPHPQVVALAARNGVEVTGEVDEIRPWLRAAQVFVCPMLSGTGIKNKLLEAMASELPCVVTPLALQGLDVTAGQHLLVGESADELATHILSVLNDNTLARSLGRAARRYVLASHSWHSVANAYEDVYRNVQQEFRNERRPVS